MRLRAVIIVLACAALTPSRAGAQSPPPPPPIDGGGGGGTTTPTQPPPNTPNYPGYPGGMRYPGAGQYYKPGAVGQSAGSGQNGQPGGGSPAAGGYYPGQPGQGYPQQNGNGADDQQGSSAMADIQVPPPPDHVIDLLPTDQTLYVISGDVVRLKGHYADMAHPLDHSFLEIDRGHATSDVGIVAEAEVDVPGGSVDVKPVDDNSTSDDYQFDWTSIPGDHYLRVGYVSSIHAKRFAEYAHVVGIDKSPLEISPDKLTSVVDIPVTVTVASDSPIVARKIDVFMDEKQVGDSVAGPPFKFTLPTGKATVGKHTLRIEAYDNQEGRFELYKKDFIEVPKRITLDVPKSFTMAKAGDAVTVKPTLGEGFTPTKIEYYLKPDTGDAKLAATAVTEPFGANLDLSTFSAGQYTLYAVSYVGDDKFQSDDYPLSFSNPYGDAAAAKAAADAAAEKAKEDEENSEKAAEADLLNHPKLTWEQVNQKVTDTIANFLAARPAGGGKRWALSSIKHVRQPDQSQNVYLVAVIVDSPEMTGIHDVYSVDLDKMTVTDLQKTW